MPTKKVLIHGTNNIDPSTVSSEQGVAKRHNLFSPAEQSRYQQDLTPCTIQAVRGWITFWDPSEDLVTVSGFVGAGLMPESAEVGGQLDQPGELAVTGPLHETSRYRRWHKRVVLPFLEGATDTYPLGDQQRFNRRSLSTTRHRKLYTVDDSYYLWVQASPNLNHQIFYSYNFEIFLKGT